MQQLPVNVDWSRAEELFQADILSGFCELPDRVSCRSAAFPGLFTEEGFYGLFIDCDATYIGMKAHLNTEFALQRFAREMLENDSDLFNAGSLKEMCKLQRWRLNAWSEFETVWSLLQGRRDDPKHQQDLLEVCRQLDEAGMAWGEADLGEDFHEQFMEMCCRVVVSLERSGLLDRLPKAPDFRVVCVEQSESFSKAENRLNRVRHQHST